MSGYRLVFDQNANDRLAIVARSGGKTVSVAQRDGVTAFGDGRNHKMIWTRGKDGKMTVTIDGRLVLKAQDASIASSFNGFSFVSLAGGWNIRSISTASAE
ncbi:MAG: hypothetical protein ACKVH0_16555 [Alphaproteobacteria bacterium]|jgi:hypothetical protein